MTTTSPYRDLSPQTWRNVLVLAVIFHAARARLARLYDMGTQAISVRSVLDQLALAAREASSGDSDDDEDEDVIVSKAVKAWDAELDAVLSRKTLEPEAHELLTEVRRLVSCCVARDPFKVMFEAIEARAQAVYGEAWRPTALSIACMNSHPRPGAHSEADPYTVTALTPWPPTAGKAEVELLVYSDRFGPAAFAALPMLLTHECVCHVPARQDKAKNGSPFAEGFMDWAAYHFFQEWAGALDPEFAPAARTHAKRLTHVLTQLELGKEAAARRLGHEAAESLLSWFEGPCGLPHDEAGPRVARLAVELNQVDGPIAMKDLFISKLALPFPRGLSDLLQDWVAGKINTSQLFTATMPSFPFPRKPA